MTRRSILKSSQTLLFHKRSPHNREMRVDPPSDIYRKGAMPVRRTTLAGKDERGNALYIASIT